MEAFGIAIVLAGGLLAAPVFCFLLTRLGRRFPEAASVVFWIATALVVAYAVEIILVSVCGILATRALLGPPYFLAHALLAVSAAPALGCVLIFGRRSIASWWPLVAIVCWFVGAGSVFYQYHVAETLYGIDGQGGPYQSPW